MRIRLTIAYDGAAFSGWQSQASGSTVQDVLESAICRVAGGTVRIHGAGRTDTGVHALAQVAHFDTPGVRLGTGDWARALNANLPPEIRVLRAARVASDFHARYSAAGKVYRYVVFNRPVLPPHLHRRVWHVPHELDDALLRRATGIFVGRHDFRAFSANRSKPVKDTVRTIRSIRVVRSGPTVRLTFEGDGFLYKMVRMLAGAAVRVAVGRASLDSVQRLLASGSCGRWSYVAPADGLFLVRVIY